MAVERKTRSRRLKFHHLLTFDFFIVVVVVVAFGLQELPLPPVNFKKTVQVCFSQLETKKKPNSLSTIEARFATMLLFWD